MKRRDVQLKLNQPEQMVRGLAENRFELGTSYRGAASWAALVESIHNIQGILAADLEPDSADDAEATGLEVVAGRRASIKIKEVVESLPSRQDADKIIMAYLKARFSPSSSSTRTTKAAQCLVAGRYLKGKLFSVEALLMHTHSRNVQNLGGDSSLWSLYGLTVRLVQRQGYHRDAAKASGSRALTRFEAEMRRRTWFLIQSTDLFLSFRNGMPPIITQDACDVDHPTNLTDDFDQDTVSLPAPRPSMDPTPILACITKSKLCLVMRRVVRQVLAVTPAAYSETLALNQELRDWHNSVPLMYLEGLCILNRPYLAAHKHDVEHNAARQICRESALAILEIRAELDIETGFMVSHLTLHRFLLAAMIVCLNLSESTDIRPGDKPKRIATIRTAYSISSTSCTASSDALHASRVLRAILSQIDHPRKQWALAANDTLFGDAAGAAMPSFEDMFDNTTRSIGSLDQYIQFDSRSWRQFFSGTSL
ncbi:hypothetical protein V8C37DRAFT_409530 [Trichoderma ceciliae]